MAAAYHWKTIAFVPAEHGWELRHLGDGPDQTPATVHNTKELRCRRGLDNFDQIITRLAGMAGRFATTLDRILSIMKCQAG